MGLFDRLLGSRNASTPAAAPAPAKKDESFFLDADASSTMGNVDFMRRSNTIRHTFPGTASTPGMKEMVVEVASMEARLEKLSPGLPGSESAMDDVNLTGGVPKPVKKTFAEKLSQAELDARKKGSAVGVNVPGGTAAIKRDKEASASTDSQPQISQTNARPGSIDAFKGWAKDINA